ncbi:MAG: hypothetical protein JSU66_07350 [Deltaproteobacteria bacterium]|nr:MAG: hypothetical protein JSU66_07350 [Deltaproteobacteria bacterium]
MGRILASLALGLSLVLAPSLGRSDQHQNQKGPKVEKSKGAEKSEGKAQGAAMRERRDEGKAIKEAYREDVKAGGERVKGKKPWWKFWGSAEEE